MHFLQSAYGWLPRVSEAETPQEREEWIRFWKQTLRRVLQTLDERDKHGELEGTPYESDRWVLERVAATIIDMQPSDMPEEMWKPILALGPGTHYWIESFLDDFFIYGLRFDPQPMGFRQRWVEMIDYVAKASEWSLSSPLGFRASTVWQSLLGMDWVYQSAWDASQRDLVREMTPHYESWCRWSLSDGWAVKAFLSFLRNPASDPILIPSLNWVAAGVPFDSEYFWKDAQGDIASFLDWCWAKKRIDIRQSAPALASFMKLLEYLAGRQDAVALVLLKRVKGDS